MARLVLGIICAIFEFIAFLFLVISIPTDILRNKNKASWNGLNQRQCFSYWGTKRCGSHKHNPNKLDWRGFPTKRIRNIVNAAAAFDIIGMVTSLVCFILCIVMAAKCCGTTAPIVFAVLTVVFVITAIGCLLGVWYTKLTVGTERLRLTKLYHLGFSSILTIAAWCVQVIILILLIITACCCSSSGDKGKEEDKASQHPSGEPDHEEPEDHAAEHSPV